MIYSCPIPAKLSAQWLRIIISLVVGSYKNIKVCTVIRLQWEPLLHLDSEFEIFIGHWSVISGGDPGLGLADYFCSAD